LKIAYLDNFKWFAFLLYLSTINSPDFKAFALISSLIEPRFLDCVTT
jgi:hypothetical protein